MLQILYLVILVTGAYGTGRRVWRRVDFDYPLDEFIASSGLGLAIYSFIILFIGLLGILKPWLILLLLLTGFLTGLSPLVGFVSRLRSGEEKRSDLFTRLGLFLFGIAALLLFLLCFRPELETDAFMYHIGAPRQWLLDGAIRPIPYHMHSQFHFLIQMLNLLILGLPGATIHLCKLMQWYYGILFAGAAFAFGRRFWGKRIGVTLMCASFFAAEVGHVVRGGMIDLAVAFYVIMAVYFLIQAVGSKRLLHHIQAGLFFGFAFSAKNTGVLFFIAAYAAFFLLPVLDKRASWEKRWRYPLAAGAIMILVTLPWILKNAFFTGNPFYPFANDWFPTNPDYADMARGFSYYYSGFGGYNTPIGMVTHLGDKLPLFIRNIFYMGAPVIAMWSILGILLLIMRFSAATPRERCLMLLGIFILPMILLTPFDRFILGLYPVAFAVFWAGFRRVVRSAIILNLCLLLFIFGYARSFVRKHIYTPKYGWEVTLVTDDWEARHGRWKSLYQFYLPSDRDILACLHNLDPENSRVLICYNSRLLVECPVPYIGNPHMHTSNMIRMLLERMGPEAALQQLDSMGVTHVIVKRREMWEIKDFLERHYRRVQCNRVICLFERRR